MIRTWTKITIIFDILRSNSSISTNFEICLRRIRTSFVNIRQGLNQVNTILPFILIFLIYQSCWKLKNIAAAYSFYSCFVIILNDMEIESENVRNIPHKLFNTDTSLICRRRSSILMIMFSRCRISISRSPGCWVPTTTSLKSLSTNAVPATIHALSSCRVFLSQIPGDVVHESESGSEEDEEHPDDEHRWGVGCGVGCDQEYAKHDDQECFTAKMTTSTKCFLRGDCL